MVLCYNKYGFATEIEIERSLLHEMDVIFQKSMWFSFLQRWQQGFRCSGIHPVQQPGAIWTGMSLSMLFLLNGSGGRIPKNWRFSELGRCLLQALEIQSDAGIFALESLLFFSPCW